MRFLFKEIRKGFISNKAKLQAVEANTHLKHSVVGIKIALVPSSHKFIVGLGSLGERPRPPNCKDFLFQHSLLRDPYIMQDAQEILLIHK